MVTFRCEEELFKELSALAGAKDLSVSELLRETVQQVVQKETA